MTALLLFAASFAVVFALGFQQMNVHARLYQLAFATSLAIGVAQLVQFKLLPQPTGWLDVAGYLFGNAFGIVAAMKAHPAVMAWRTGQAEARGRRAAFRDEPAKTLRDAIAAALKPDPDAAPIVQLEQTSTAAERAEIEATLCLEAAVTEVEMFCHPLATSFALFYDVRTVTDIDRRWSVDRALHYLQLRDAIAFHPTLPHLVRLKQP